METAALDTSSKPALYASLLQQISAVLDGIDDPVATMASTACLIHEALEVASWTGFYRVVAPELLRVGPYQGPLGCLEIPFDRGVCGAAARSGKTQLVEDVDAFPGHVACDASARSEIVLPVHDRQGQLVAVLDIDSHQPGAFDAEDQRGLEAIVARLSEHWS